MNLYAASCRLMTGRVTEYRNPNETLLTSIYQTFQLFFKSLRSPRLWGLAALAALPSEFLGLWTGWGMMDWQTYVAELIWTPAMLWCQLQGLAWMGQILSPSAQPPLISARTLASSFGAEILLSLRFCGVALACLVPALAALAVLGWEKPSSRVAVSALALAGALPAAIYLLRRLFSQPVVLWQGLNASQALAESAALTRGKLKSVLAVLLAMNLLALGLQGLSETMDWLFVPCLPLAFLLATTALAWSYRQLHQP